MSSQLQCCAAECPSWRYVDRITHTYWQMLIVGCVGPVQSSYAVEDRVQVPDIDPSMIVDYVDDDVADFQPCPICGDSDNEELLLLCDCCDVPSHTYCVGLDAVPSTPWFCNQCEEQGAVGVFADSSVTSPRGQDGRGRRTRAQLRRLQTRNHMNSLHWARVWQSVWDHLNLDLDFPFDDDRAAQRALQQQRREEANQREFRAWQRRFEVAERQGASHRFRDTAALLDIDAPRPSRPRAPREPTPEPESLEEMRAWNAFERAREIENDPSAARKRKEPTLSPSPEPTEPERKLKRPRTRRPQELAALASQNGESSRTASAQATARINAEPSNEPSFLQSLLKEVEEASTPGGTTISYGPSGQITNVDHATSGPSSPSLSPAPSNQSSPCLSTTSPPPYSRSRPISPLQLSSPAGPSSPPFSPDVSPSTSRNNDLPEPTRRTDAGRSRSRIPQAAQELLNARSLSNSPTRPGPSMTVKSDIQRLVGKALKPYYRRDYVSKDEYTDINRSISRKLYERAGDSETLDEDAKTDLATVAKEEVQRAIATLRMQKQKHKDGSSADGNS